VVIDGQEVARPKPDPEIYCTTARRLGVPPQDCIVFEDSDPGVAAARAAGMRVVGFLTTTNELPDCDLVVPDFRAAKLSGWLRKQSATSRDREPSV
jgi:beta-phosphoglucomutase